MAGAPISSVKADAAASGNPAPTKEVGYLVPPSSIQAAPADSARPMPTNTATEHVIVPPRGTLAAGRWEAKPSTIWIVVAAGALLLLGWALFRVRRGALARRKQLEAMTSVAGRAGDARSHGKTRA